MNEVSAINVNIPAALNAELEAQAKARLTSKSALVREVLLNHVNKSEARPQVHFARRGRRQNENKP